MRLILVDSRSDELCGDVSACTPMFQKLPRHIACADIEALAKASARLLDETAGRHSRSYRFACFAPSNNNNGYQLYIAREDTTLFPGTGNERVGTTLTDVLTKCFYFGFVSSSAKPKDKVLRIMKRMRRTMRKARNAAAEAADHKGVAHSLSIRASDHRERRRRNPE